MYRFFFLDNPEMILIVGGKVIISGYFIFEDSLSKMTEMLLKDLKQDIMIAWNKEWIQNSAYKTAKLQNSEHKTAKQHNNYKSANK